MTGLSPKFCRWLSCPASWFFVAFIAVSPAGASEQNVPASPGALARAVEAANPGDVLLLAPGRHDGPIQVNKPLTLSGAGNDPGAVHVVGNGSGSVITVTAPDVIIRGLTISGSGSSADNLDSGVQLLKKARGAQVRGNRILGNLVGVDIHGAKDAVVEGNVIEGRRDHRMNSRGNGVYVWNAPGAEVTGNDIRWGRDGIFVNTSRDNAFKANRFRDLRFGIHYMYAHDSTVVDNVSQGNHLGFAVMYSRNVHLEGNLSEGDRDYGIMLNYANESVISGNHVLGAGDRCVFIYNAHKNQFGNNWFEGCNIGVHFTAGSERNHITGNAFVSNRTQVKYVGSQWIDWSDGGRGNYWSDHGAFDLDGDGIAESPYRPNDGLDRVLWKQPAARLLLGSPATQLIRWSLSSFPAFLPGGVIDSHPLMNPDKPSLPDWQLPL